VPDLAPDPVGPLPVDLCGGLPDRGLPADALMSALDALRGRDARWREGTTFAYCYDPGPEVEAIGKAAYMAFLGENALDPLAFPSLLELENALVGIGARHLGGGADVAGNFTTGGTESITLALKTARDHARARGREGRLNVVVPETAHAAFHKAARLLDLEARVAPVDGRTWRAVAADLEPLIDGGTVLLVASAPSYGIGVIDDVPGIAALAQSRGLLCHVDACVGGWLLPLWRALGEPVPPFDFSVPGVSSLSVDLHKYAFCPKGASLILYRDPGLRAHQITSVSDWLGYTVINPTLLSTRSGGPLAGAWATLHALGREGYLDIARRTLEGTRALVAGLQALPPLRVEGPPDFCLVAASAPRPSEGGVSLFHVVDEMKARGWTLQAQLGRGAHRETLHASLTPATAARVPELLRDLREALRAAADLPDPTPDPGLVAALAGQPAAALGPELIDALLSSFGGGGGLPERLAPISALLNELPAAHADRLFTLFFNRLNHRAPGDDLLARLQAAGGADAR
jgi:glutamate/tyrosine decarboxylase-like PLP-dependent enzyme